MKYRENGIRKRIKEKENKRTVPATTINLQSILHDLMELNVQNGCSEMEYTQTHTTTHFTSYENEPHSFSLTQHKFMLIQRDGFRTGIYKLRLKKCKSFTFNPLNTKRRSLYLKTQSVPRSKHFSSRL